MTMTVQEALDRLVKRREVPRSRRPDIHDHGSQFTSHEWLNFVKGAGITDIKTRVAHPESTGRFCALAIASQGGAASQDTQRRGVDRRSADRLLCSVRRYGTLG